MTALGRLVVTLVICAIAGAGSCERAARRHPVSLEDEVFTFHQALKNRRFGDAARFIKPEHRQAFLEEWQRGEGLAEFQDLEVTRVDRSSDADYAHVEATLTYVMRNSLTVKQHRLVELWRGEGTTWVLDGSPSAPPEFRAPPAPVADEPAMSPPIYVPAPGGERDFGGGAP